MNVYPTLTSSEQVPIDGPKIILIFVAFVGAVLLILIAKKIYYYIRYRRRYYIFPKINTTGISNTAMVISISVTIILLLTVLSAGAMGIFFRVYPGWRVTIEGILIKIGGLLFGPIIGLFIGALTDILTVALTAGMFHYGFFIIALAYGFFSGIIRVFINICKKNTALFVFLVTLLAIAVSAVASVYIMVTFDVYTLTLFTVEIVLQNWLLMTVFISFNVLLLAILWICLWIFQRNRTRLFLVDTFLFFRYTAKKLRYIRHLRYNHSCNLYSLKLLMLHSRIEKSCKKVLAYRNDLVKRIILRDNLDYSWFDAFAPVIALIVVVEPLIEVVMMPVFDQQLGGGIPLDYWITYRIFFGIVVALVNLFVVLPIFKTVRQIMKYDYRSSIVEGLSKTLIS
ncbi:MAG: hypothetical protein LBV22_01765 [Mycoplasmataceae bacterium]|nr:hypothetical protein [Mycoplasmataceae bacterium]